METRSKYEKLLSVYVEAHPSLKKADAYKNAQKVWNALKDDDEKFNREILRLKSKISLNKSRNINAFFRTSSTTIKPGKDTEKNSERSEAGDDELQIVEEENSSDKPSETKGLLIHTFKKHEAQNTKKLRNT